MKQEHKGMLKRPINSALTPPAQYATLCAEVTSRESLISLLQKHQDGIMKESRPLWYLLHIMATSGARISEVLRIRTSDISNSGSFILRAGKSSKDRLIVDIEAAKYLLTCKRNSIYPFAQFNRFFVYRYMDKLGLSMEIAGHSKRAVTHSLRHEVLQSAKGVESDMAAAQAFIGHKSNKSTQHYGNGKSKRNSN